MFTAIHKIDNICVIHGPTYSRMGIMCTRFQVASEMVRPCLGRASDLSPSIGESSDQVGNPSSSRMIPDLFFARIDFVDSNEDVSPCPFYPTLLYGKWFNCGILL
jgi:hypothetical protein